MPPETLVDPFALAEARLAGLRTLAEEGAALASILDAEAQIASLRMQLANGQVSIADVAAALAATIQRAERTALLAPQHAIALNLTEARSNAANYLSTSGEQLDTLWNEALDAYGEDISDTERRRLEALRQEELAAIEAGDLHAAFEARNARLDIMEDVFVRNGDDVRAEEVRAHRAQAEQEQARLREAEAQSATNNQEAAAQTASGALDGSERADAQEPLRNDADLLLAELGLTDLPDGTDVAPCPAHGITNASCQER